MQFRNPVSQVFSTFKEWHYFAVGLSWGILIGYILHDVLTSADS